MEPRINSELAEHDRQAQEKSRKRWPDDGLPPRFKTVKRPGTDHPASVVAELFWR